MKRYDVFLLWHQGFMTQFFAPCPLFSTDKYRRRPIVWDLLYGRYNDIEFPLICQQKKGYGGKKFTDFLNTGYPNFYPISDNVLNLLVENNITGWKTYPIKVYDKFGSEIPGYHGLSITGRCKDVDLSLLNEKVDYQYIKDGPVYQYYKGFPLDLSTWDGSDMFLLSGTAYHFCTRKVYDIFKKNKISNIVYENVMDHIVKEDTEELFRTNSFKNKECYNW